MTVATSDARSARVGDLLPDGPRRTARRLDARALLLPGRGDLVAYSRSLEAHREDFDAWDGVVEAAEPDGQAEHRLLIVDRYGQVYAVHDARDASDLPDAAALTEWFKFLATACPECGVIDDPVRVGPTP
ncbi:MAG: hypothetical protein IT341_09970 [Chloroflexi bacterium]|nr:hypothetical protein [Chloroflexota bacterium]